MRKRLHFGGVFLFLDMKSFLAETVRQLLDRTLPLSDHILILPSKRAGGFLKQILISEASQNYFAPKIISIEEFVAEISGLSLMTNTEVLIESHVVYNKIKATPFDEYISWAETILNDFNEIDRHLVPQKEFFQYLSGIKILEKWGVTDSETPMIKEYLSFWKSLYQFYTQLNEHLLLQQKGYQGMMYRKASEEMEFYLDKHGKIPHVFIGFNAMNKAEQTIVQELLEQGTAEVFWDMDTHFIEDPFHSAAHFFRKYQKEWKFYQTHEKPSGSIHFEKAKNIVITESPSDVEQVKILSNILAQLPVSELEKTAVVLADEALLIPLLYSLPKEITEVNITMGYPLKALPVVQFFATLLEAYSKPSTTIYYRTIQNILNHVSGEKLIPGSKNLLKQLASQNRTFISLPSFIELGADETQRLSINELFDFNLNNPSEVITRLKAHVKKLIEWPDNTLMDQRAYQKLSGVFVEIDNLERQYQFLKNNQSLKHLFDALVGSNSLDLEGDAYRGLQVMGVLETRGLDFENVIMLSVNEGTLPTGKSNNSFLTYDLKKQFELPMHTEKDAIYSYHFFRLLQRSKQIHFLYNSAATGLNTGEASRFLRQLEIEKCPKHTLTYRQPKSKLIPTANGLRSYLKSQGVQERIKQIAEKGFSPSALTSYIRNPKDFYYQRILKVNELDEVEETIAYNTLGTIVHDSLEELYKPFVGEFLSVEGLEKALRKVSEIVLIYFDKHYQLGDITRGKNLIIFEVAKKYVENLILWDLNHLKQHAQIELLDLELSLKVPLDQLSLGFPVFLTGMVDRIDRFNGTLRIIDYKTGKVSGSDVLIYDWELLTQDYKYSKAFQVLTYAYMRHLLQPEPQLEAGIISFKNMREGFMPFGTKASSNARTKNHAITPSVLTEFESHLVQLITEICNPEVPFTEKLVE